MPGLPTLMSGKRWLSPKIALRDALSIKLRKRIWVDYRLQGEMGPLHMRVFRVCTTWQHHALCSLFFFFIVFYHLLFLLHCFAVPVFYIAFVCFLPLNNRLVNKNEQIIKHYLIGAQQLYPFRVP